MTESREEVCQALRRAKILKALTTLNDEFPGNDAPLIEFCKQVRKKYQCIPTEADYHKGIAMLCEKFPEEADKLRNKKDKIVDTLFRKVAPKPELTAMQHSPKQSAVQAMAIDLPSLTPCEEAIAVVVVDVVFFVLGLLGLHTSNQERITRALIRELGGATLRGFSRAVRAFSQAEGAFNKARALFTLFGQIYKAGGFSAVFKVIKDEMSWWDWVKTGLIAVAQVTAWVATDGVAFIAEAALQIMSAEQLIEDAVKAVKACS